jgi:hypothetical protein
MVCPRTYWYIDLVLIQFFYRTARDVVIVVFNDIQILM